MPAPAPDLTIWAAALQAAATVRAAHETPGSYDREEAASFIIDLALRLVAKVPERLKGDR
jgi:hypothetical protein